MSYTFENNVANAPTQPSRKCTQRAHVCGVDCIPTQSYRNGLEPSPRTGWLWDNTCNHASDWMAGANVVPENMKCTGAQPKSPNHKDRLL